MSGSLLQLSFLCQKITRKYHKVLIFIIERCVLKWKQELSCILCLCYVVYRCLNLVHEHSLIHKATTNKKLQDSRIVRRDILLSTMYIVLIYGKSACSIYVVNELNNSPESKLRWPHVDPVGSALGQRGPNVPCYLERACHRDQHSAAHYGMNQSFNCVCKYNTCALACVV